MKTNELVLVASVIADVIPAIVREPVDAVNPGFMSVGALKLDAVIADTAMEPGAETMAGAPAALDDTSVSITKPEDVWVITLKIPAA